MLAVARPLMLLGGAVLLYFGAPWLVGGAAARRARTGSARCSSRT